MSDLLKTFSDKLLSLPSKVSRILLNAGESFYLDDGFSRAAALAYSSLLALVPITVFTVQTLLNFQFQSEEIIGAFQGIVERMLPPGENEQAKAFLEQILGFVVGITNDLTEDLGRLGTLTLLTLVVTSIALFNTIQSALDAVWRVQSESGIISRIMAHWSIFTAWLILIGVTIVWTARFGALSEKFGFLQSESIVDLTLLFPTIMTWFVLSVLYAKVPAAPVRYRDAFFGALVASVLFELTKRGFAYYVGVSSTYSALYGLLAAVPLFLLWLYLIWVIVVFGAHLTYQAGNISLMGGLKRYSTQLGEVGSILGLRILQLISQRFIRGEEPPTEGELVVESSADPVLVRTCLDILTDAEILTLPDPERHSRTLTRTPRKILVSEIIGTFLSKKNKEGNSDGRNAILENLASVARASNQPIRELTLEEFSLKS